MIATLDEIFTRQTSETTATVDPYTELLASVANSCPDANIVLESQQYSKLAAIQQGGCEIFQPDDFAGDELPFNPNSVGVQITYYLNSDGEWDLAWVATWGDDEDESVEEPERFDGGRKPGGESPTTGEAMTDEITQEQILRDQERSSPV